jgi:cellulose synthase/poly-beta-1,6-N-acetylglucosamine synthase-like glycosyltransferase
LTRWDISADDPAANGGYNRTLPFPIALVLFSISLLFLLYVLFGYPLLLKWLSRRPNPIRRQPFQPTVSFIVAVHNGERFLQQKLDSILNLDYPREKMEIIIASDGSTDRTAEIGAQFAPHGVRFLALPRGGKPQALNAAISQAAGEILVLTDVRQIVAPDSLAYLMENFADPAVGAVSAELVIRKGGTEEEEQVGLYWRYEFWIRVCLSNIDSIFSATGAYYALRRHLAVPIPKHILLDDMYLPLAAFFGGYRLTVDARAKMFDYPTTLDVEFRRKVRTLAGNYQILLAWPRLLTPSNRMLLHFLSYKFARLLLPFALLCMMASSFWFPYPWNALLAAGQAGFCAAAIADRWIPDGFPLKKLTSPIRTFVTLMIAALFALSILFVPAGSLWNPTQVRKQ